MDKRFTLEVSFKTSLPHLDIYLLGTGTLGSANKKHICETWRYEKKKEKKETHRRQYEGHVRYDPRPLNTDQSPCPGWYDGHGVYWGMCTA